MTPEFVALIVVVLYALAGVAVLFLGGRLVRHDLDRAETRDRNSRRRFLRIVEDLRPVQDVIVEFFALSAFSRILSALARHQEPPSLNTVAQEIHFEADRSQDGDVAPTHIAWPAACIMAITGLVRFRRRGVVLTDIGREVVGRINSDSVRNTAPAGSPDIGSIGRNRDRFAPIPFPSPAEKTSGAKSHRRMVSEAIQRGASNHSAGRSRGRALTGIGELRKPRLQMVHQHHQQNRKEWKLQT